MKILSEELRGGLCRNSRNTKIITLNKAQLGKEIYEPRHDKINKMTVRQAKTQISLGIRPV